ncbi:MAG TPA: DUF4468 domain-containing protein [Flavobacterium sp.]
MKNVLVLLALIFSFIGHAQKFRFKNDGSTEYIVKSADSISAAKLYSRTLKWIDKNYKSPQDAIKARTVNQMIKLDGVMTSAFTIELDSVKSDYDVTYSLEIHFKRGKYRIKYLHHAIVKNGERPLFKLTDILNKKPEADDKNWVNHRQQYESKVQKMLNSLHHYIARK